jgi:hypothetical protein
VVKKVSQHLNQQGYVWFILAAARQHSDQAAGLKLLEEVGEAVKKDEQAALLCTIERCRWKREQGDLVGCKVPSTYVSSGFLLLLSVDVLTFCFPSMPQNFDNISLRRRY